jgi:hypothetical protein
LHKKINAAVVGAFFFIGKVTSRQLSPLPMIVQTFTTQAVLKTSVIGTGTVFSVDFDPGTLINLGHLALLTGA